MVAHLVRLKLLLLRNGLKRRPSQLIGLGVGVLYGGFAVVGACTGLVALRLAPDPRLGGALVTLVGSVLVLAWVVVPLFGFGADPTLDPRRFATFAISSRQLSLGLAASGLVGLPGLATSVVALMTIVTWSTSLPSALVAAVAAVLVVGTCVLASRVATAWAFAILTSRRGREAIIVATMVVILGYASVAPRLGESDFLGDPGLLVRLGEVIGWTPLGWALAAPWAVARGDVASGLTRLGLAAGLVGLLSLAWTRATAAMVENPRGLAVISASEKVAGLGMFGRLPGTPVGAVAARSMTMWRRDPRYQVSALALLLVPLILLVASAASGGSGVSYLGMPVLLAFFVGFGAHNDVAYDDTAFALHVSSGVPGWADRVGRLVPYGLMWAVGGSAYLVLAGWKSGRWDLLPAVLGVMVVLAGAGWGVSSVTSVLFPYPVPGPSDSPFSTPPGSVGSSLLAQSVVLGVVLAIAAPSIGLGLWRLFDGPLWSGWAALAVGVVLGALSLAVGVVRGGAYLDQNADRVLARLVKAG